MKKVIIGFMLSFCCYAFSLAQTLDVNFTGSCFSYTGLTEVQTLAQSFTSTLSGTLTKVKVGVSTESCVFTNQMTGLAKVYTESCSGTLLTTQPYTLATDSSLSMVEINFTTPPFVTAGNVYALELSVDSGQKCKIDMYMGTDTLFVFGRWHLENEYNCGGSYNGGTAYNPGCLEGTADFYLQTYVNTSVKLPEQVKNSCVIYPNPATNQLRLKIEDYLMGQDYRIFDKSGKMILFGTLTSPETLIELGDLQDGLYIIHIAQQFSQSFVVKK